MKTIGFVILTWNSQKVIGNCLESIAIMESKRLVPLIIVIDNGSSDNTLSIIDDVTNNNPDITIETIPLKSNKGTTYSRNLGILSMIKKGADYVCVLDSDTMINSDALESMIDVLEMNPNCGIVGPKMHDSNGVYQQSGRQIPTLTEKILKVAPIKKLQKLGEKRQSAIDENGHGSVEVGYLMSACWVMKTDLFEKIGLLDERIFYAPEDVDYCIRCWKNGLSVRYCYDADIIHEWQRLSRRKLISKHNYEHIKGLAYMFAKHKYLLNADKIIRKDN